MAGGGWPTNGSKGLHIVVAFHHISTTGFQNPRPPPPNPNPNPTHTDPPPRKAPPRGTHPNPSPTPAQSHQGRHLGKGGRAGCGSRRSKRSWRRDPRATPPPAPRSAGGPHAMGVGRSLRAGGSMEACMQTCQHACVCATFTGHLANGRTEDRGPPAAPGRCPGARSRIPEAAAESLRRDSTLGEPNPIGGNIAFSGGHGRGHRCVWGKG